MEKKATRYCEMCDRLVSGRECRLCGADTRATDKATREALQKAGVTTHV